MDPYLLAPELENRRSVWGGGVAGMGSHRLSGARHGPPAEVPGPRTWPRRSALRRPSPLHWSYAYTPLDPCRGPSGDSAPTRQPSAPSAARCGTTSRPLPCHPSGRHPQSRKPRSRPGNGSRGGTARSLRRSLDGIADRVADETTGQQSGQGPGLGGVFPDVHLSPFRVVVRARHINTMASCIGGVKRKI